ncbi:4'-phosphopantetheinyl transferase family protein [Streptomyces althioticus]
MPRGVGHPLPAESPDGPWDAMHEELSRTGSAVLYAAMSHWLPVGATEADLRRRLGRDWRRYEAFERPRTRERFVASRLFLRHAAAAVLHTGPDLVDLAYQPGGRPYVRGCDQIDVSLSHTEEMMVVGITRRGRIGVDVERADRRLAHTGSERQACTPYELRRLDAGKDAVRNDTMVRLWTLKEAYSKALGQGLRFRFTQFGFALDGDGSGDHAGAGRRAADRGGEGIRLVRPDGTPVPGSEWQFGTFPAGDGYVVSVAVCDTGFGEVADLSVGTTLDDGLLDTLLGTPADGYGRSDGPAGLPGTGAVQVDPAARAEGAGHREP